MKKLAFILSLLCFSNLFAAATTDDRTQLPGIFQNSYVGVDLAYLDFAYSNADLNAGYSAGQIKNNLIGASVYAGHYFNPYLALQLSYMRPGPWVKFTNVTNNAGATPETATVWLNYLMLTLRPTLPINDRWSVYGEVGPAYVSRYGFTMSNGANIPSVGLIVPDTGVGASYRFSGQWHLEFSADSIWGNAANKQPATYYGEVGAYYLFNPEQAMETGSGSPYIFPLNTIEIGLYNRSVFNWDPTTFFTSVVPIFWNGEVLTQSGDYLMYERNVYHTQRWFSLDWGVDGARWESLYDHDVYYTASIFPEVRFWLLQQPKVALYFNYSAAGPTYLSRSTIDGQATGGHFTFQDFLGFGSYFGAERNFNINLKIIHYSSGNLMPNHNPGIKVPVMLGLGYAF